ncbi:hypothetical protein NBRC3257_1707 [Gluconobacter thailandicus NBRC 3257]|uniref:Uncharacterized protein n=2 Tax=Acetobacteraceae TaxID=433 RepID=A0ABQ0IWX4_GLUTH|nr:hypothetical protein NBRC3255_2340 [Gluconobacter thailandicus NBRC 3255]GAD26708.1 hypothetical protein NBRC3257_1707 [Gluconobacter thailandicus NBRC 3257]
MDNGGTTHMAQDGHPAEDYLSPKLESLIADGVKAGFARDVVIAVLIDLLDDGPADDAEVR